MIFMINEIVTIYIYNKNIQITYKTNINKIKIWKIKKQKEELLWFILKIIIILIKNLHNLYKITIKLIEN